MSLRSFTPTGGARQLTSVLLGDVRLQGTATVTGRVLRGPTAATSDVIAGARVLAYRDGTDVDPATAFDQTLPSESQVSSGDDGRFTMPGVIPGNARVLALFRDDSGALFEVDAGSFALHAGDIVDLGDLVAQPTPDVASDVQVNVVVGGTSTAPVHVRIQKSNDSSGAAVAQIDALPGQDTALSLVPDVYDVLVVDGTVTRGGLRGVPSLAGPGRVARWVIILDATDACDGDSRDRDGDGLPSIPLARMAECKQQCAGKDGAANASAACTLDGAQFDCNDDGDDQNDPAEVSCFGACATSDGDGDGACLGVDVNPCCSASSGVCLSACSSATTPPRDAGPGPSDAGPSDAGFLPFFDEVHSDGDFDSLASLEVNASGVAVLAGNFETSAAVAGCTLAVDGSAVSPFAGYAVFIDALTGACVDSLVFEEIANGQGAGASIGAAVVDDSGTTIIAGNVAGTGRVLHAGASVDVTGATGSLFLATLSADRATLAVPFLATSAGGGVARAASLAVHGGALALAGTQETAIDVALGSIVLPALDSCCEAAFIARFDAATLQPQWAQEFGFTQRIAEVLPLGLALEPSSGDVLWLGHVGNGTVTDGNVIVVGDFNSGPGSLLQRLRASDGTSAWLAAVGGQDPSQNGIAHALSLAPSGHRLVVGGQFLSALTLVSPQNPTDLVSLGTQSGVLAGFIASYDVATGVPVAGSTAVFTPGAGAFGSDRAASVDALFAVDDSELLLGGRTDDDIALGGGVTIAGPRERTAASPFVARFDGTNATWAASGRAFGGRALSFESANDDVRFVRPADISGAVTDVLAAGNLGGRTLFGDAIGQPLGTVEVAQDGFLWRVDDGGRTRFHGCAARSD
ncbi:MAG TPA: hypothetical protein VGO62_16755, partial [Myxococcota bacterium]